ncbi:MAG: hypothetical protein ACE5JQ_13340, partial [Candidatus Methylomirabilales bacterium]
LIISGSRQSARPAEVQPPRQPRAVVAICGYECAVKTGKDLLKNFRRPRRGLSLKAAQASPRPLSRSR